MASPRKVPRWRLISSMATILPLRKASASQAVHNRQGDDDGLSIEYWYALAGSPLVRRGVGCSYAVNGWVGVEQLSPGVAPTRIRWLTGRAAGRPRNGR